MPTDENLYGQWPRCGEIDVMEVMGSDVTKAYGTIHYGNPHKENQGTHVLTEGDFASEYHVFSCDWEPGCMIWYIDGKEYYRTQNWHSTTVGQGTLTYPAPFDQPFYMILNLAVGGSWVGYPNQDTDFENAAFEVDYVRVYQKDSYDENVKQPEKKVIIREADTNGNYINNGDFSVAEDLTDDKNWKFMTALGEEAKAEIKEDQISIETTAEGTVDYSVQLVQADIPFVKGAEYKMSFDAWADNKRTMKVAVKAPDNGYAEYFKSVDVALTEKPQTFTYTFKMTEDSDANGRLEYNMGALGSTDTIHIKNVKIEKIEDPKPNAEEEKTILTNGNYVYNGAFQEGEKRLGYWQVAGANSDTNVFVSDLSDGRRFNIVIPKGKVLNTPVTLTQTKMALTAGKKYVLSFDGEGTEGNSFEVSTITDEKKKITLTNQKQNYRFAFDTEKLNTISKDITFYFENAGTVKLDNIRIEEDVMVKNGDFSAGFSNYEVYVSDNVSASYVVDSQTEGNENAADFTINKTGTEDWNIQLKQNNIKLEKGKCYKLSYDMRSNLARETRVIMQGGEAKGWPVYSEDKRTTLLGDMKWQSYTNLFKMENETDAEAFLSICLGKVDREINEQHRICIDNISLVEVPESELNK